MANGRRSIYSRRQSMPAGSYDTPLADFLDAIPGYITQYQQNQLQLNKQALQEKRYDDAIKQRDYTNELNLYKLLPDDVRSAAMSKSENEDISQIGTKAVNNKKAFFEQLNFADVSKSDVEMLDYYDNLLISQNIAGNTTREKQVKNKKKSLQNRMLKDQIEEYYKDKTTPLKSVHMQRSAYEPDEVMKEILDLETKTMTGTRETFKGADGYNYYLDTKERVLPNIVKSAPMGSSLEALNALLKSAENNLRFNKSKMTSKAVEAVENEIEGYKNQIKSLLPQGIGQPTINTNPFSETSQESTRIDIPGLKFD
tara:strand:+ start:1057 stop:1992 length:936 start_codon:yes stop_codon:yes gene_type:complete